MYKAYGWWIGRNNQFNYYWGGAAPGTFKCACGLAGKCLRPLIFCSVSALSSSAVSTLSLLRDDRLRSNLHSIKLVQCLQARVKETSRGVTAMQG